MRYGITKTVPVEVVLGQEEGPVGHLLAMAQVMILEMVARGQSINVTEGEFRMTVDLIAQRSSVKP